MASPADPPRSLPVGEGEGGTRLDLFLAERLSLSRSQVRRLLARGAVRVDGRLVAEGAKGLPLPAGARVEVLPFRRPEDQRAREAPDTPLRVLAEGPGWLAVDKPAGVPVHPLREGEAGTLLGAALLCYPEIHGVGEGGLRSGVVHRLDVDTSGVLLLAREQEAWRALRRAFQERRVQKVYRALVAGRLEGEGRLERGLALARHRPARVRVVPPAERARARGVRDCSMSWQALRHFETATLVEVRPVTGFLHQIRVLMAHLGHPLLGDRTYARPAVAEAAPRHMLHAARIAWEGGEAESADAADFAAQLSRLGAGRREP